MADDDQAYKDDVAPLGSPFRPLYDNRIMFNGQPIALVVAETSEIARFAASLVRVEYEKEAHVTDVYRQREAAIPVRPPTNPIRGAVHAAEDARQTRAGARRRGGAPRRRILRSDRASQPDGALCLDGDLRRTTASSRSTTRRKACRTSSAISAACSA